MRRTSRAASADIPAHRKRVKVASNGEQMQVNVHREDRETTKTGDERGDKSNDERLRGRGRSPSERSAANCRNRAQAGRGAGQPKRPRTNDEKDETAASYGGGGRATQRAAAATLYTAQRRRGEVLQLEHPDRGRGGGRRRSLLTEARRAGRVMRVTRCAASTTTKNQQKQGQQRARNKWRGATSTGRRDSDDAVAARPADGEGETDRRTARWMHNEWRA